MSLYGGENDRGFLSAKSEWLDTSIASFGAYFRHNYYPVKFKILRIKYYFNPLISLCQDNSL
jgi:hypothetical protein